METKRKEIKRRLINLLIANKDTLFIDRPVDQISDKTQFIWDYRASQDQNTLNLDSLGFVEALEAIADEFGIVGITDAMTGDLDECKTIGSMADFLVAHATK